MYYLTDFKHFVSIFSSFSIQLTPFYINFKFFDHSFLQKLRSDWVHFFFMCCTRVPKIWWGYSPPKWPSAIRATKHYVWATRFQLLGAQVATIALKYVCSTGMMRPNSSQLDWKSQKWGSSPRNPQAMVKPCPMIGSTLPGSEILPLLKG